MLVFVKEKLVILAVPKTGTTALSAALASRASLVLRSPPQLKHTTTRRYQRFLRPFLMQNTDDTLEVMAMVRHPVDWLGSWYRYRTRDALVGHQKSTRGISFDDFVLEYCKGKPAPFAAVGSQNRFVHASDGELGVDHLFQYEAQDQAIAFLTDRLGIAIDLPQRNVSPEMTLVLSPDVAAKLREKRAEEFDVWEMAKR